MNDTPTPLDGFEQRLLTELRAEVQAPELVARPLAARRRRYALAGAAALVVGGGAAVAGPMLLGSSNTPKAAAYALQTEPNGHIHVTINRLEDATGLERAFADKGVTAQVDFVPDGKKCVREYQHARIETVIGIAARVDGDGFTGPYTFEVAPAGLSGRTLVITGSDAAGPPVFGSGDASNRPIAVDVARGQVPPCTLVDAP